MIDMGKVTIKGKGKSVCQKADKAYQHIISLANSLGLKVKNVKQGVDQCELVLEE